MFLKIKLIKSGCTPLTQLTFCNVWKKPQIRENLSQILRTFSKIKKLKSSRVFVLASLLHQAVC